VFGGGRCYDCTAFRSIVHKYLIATFGYNLDPVDNQPLVDEICGWIEGELLLYVNYWNSRF
jgi:hypothetical protein